MRIFRYIRWYIHNSLPQRLDSVRHPIRSIPVYRITELTEGSYQELKSLGNVFEYNMYHPVFMTHKDELLEEENGLEKYNFLGILDNKIFKLEEELLRII